MIESIREIPEVIFTSIEGGNVVRLELWKREAVIYQSKKHTNLYVNVGLNRPAISSISAINLQMIALKANVHFSLMYVDEQWWVAQQFDPEWQYSNEEDRRKFMTQFATARWLEDEYNVEKPKTHVTQGIS